MAERRPLVIIDGQSSELPNGDSLPQLLKNIVEGSITVPTNTSEMIIGTLVIEGNLTLDGNIGII